MNQIYNKLIVTKVIPKKIEKIEETKSQVDELLGDLNPNYFKEVITLEEAKNRAMVSYIHAGGKFNFFNTY